MKIYYETSHHDGGDFPVITAHDTLEKAIEFAEAHDISTVYENGGSYDEYEKCWFCGEWEPAADLDRGLCWRCKLAMYSRGEEV